jgi:2-phosphosulfolactate phosphatase
MHIVINNLLSGAAKAKGTAAVIDVFRACSTACYAIGAGATRIIPADSVEHALALKDAHPDFLLMGERGCIKPEGFDFGNSPTEIKDADLSGKTLIHATSAGTRGLLAAMDSADDVLALSFVNLSATGAYLVARMPEIVTLAAMGRAGETPAPEDKLCAMYLKNELEGVPNVMQAIRQFLRNTPSAEIFFGDTAIVPETDFDLCLELDAFDFVLRARRAPEGFVELAPVGPGKGRP